MNCSSLLSSAGAKQLREIPCSESGRTLRRGPALQPELFHGFTHESGQIGRLPGGNQIAVNNHL
jgi:hypothetical protein